MSYVKDNPFSDNLLLGTIDKIISPQERAWSDRLVFHGTKDVTEKEDMFGGKVYQASIKSFAIKQETGVLGLIDRCKTRLSEKFFFVQFKYMDASGNTREVMMNVGSLSKRLGLGRTEILAAAERGILETMVLQKTCQDQECYLEYDEKVEKRAEEIVKSYSGIDQSGFDKEQLKKVIKLAMTVPLGGREKPYALIRTPYSKTGEVQELVVQRDTQQQLKILTNLSTCQVIAKGNTLIEKVQNVVDGHPLVYKTAVKDKASGDLVHEVNNLRDIRVNGITAATQLPPHVFINLKDKQGILTDHYSEGDLHDHLYTNTNRDVCKINVEQTLKAMILDLEQYAKMGLINGDIKNENVFVKNENGKAVCYLSDWGGARYIENINGLVVHTEELLKEQDFANIKETAAKKNSARNILIEAEKGKDQEKIQEAQASYKKALEEFKKAYVMFMIYCLGDVFLSIIAVYNKKKFFPLAKRMIKLDPKKRITLEELVQLTR